MPSISRAQQTHLIGVLLLIAVGAQPVALGHGLTCLLKGLSVADQQAGAAKLACGAVAAAAVGLACNGLGGANGIVFVVVGGGGGDVVGRGTGGTRHGLDRVLGRLHAACHMHVHTVRYDLFRAS